MAVISPLSQQQTKIFGPVFFVCLCCVFQFFKKESTHIYSTCLFSFMKNPVGLLFVTANVRKTMKKQKVQTILWGQ